MNSFQYTQLNKDFQPSYALAAYAAELLPANEIVTEFINGLWDPKNKTASIASWFVPILASSLAGGGVLGFLVAVLTEVFDVEIKQILVEIVNKFQEFLGLKDGDVDPEKIDPEKLKDDSFIDKMLNYFKEKYNTAIADSYQKIIQLKNFIYSKGKNLLDYITPDVLKNDDVNYKISFRMQQLTLIKNANNSQNIVKNAAGLLHGIKGKILEKIFDFIKWIFKSIFKSLGFKLAGEGTKALVTDKKNALTGTSGGVFPIFSTPKPAEKITAKTPTQTVFPPNPSYKDQDYHGSLWQENYQNNSQNIKTLLLDFAKECYLGLSERKDLDLIAEHSDGFKKIQNIIEDHNQLSVGANLVIIPSILSSKKNIVNFFIDEFADFAKELDKKISNN